MMFDVVIPVGPHNVERLHGQLQHVRKNVNGCRDIYLVTRQRLPQHDVINNCTIVHENCFPFTLDTVAEHHGSNHRNGWYLQQLIKLYAGEVIPGISENYLVIDADTYFLKPTEFVEDGKCLYRLMQEYYPPYFKHIHRLGIGLEKVHEKSGVAHHMMFQIKHVSEMFKMIEDVFDEPFYTTFLKQVDPDFYLKSGASEYELYFSYMLTYHPEEVVTRTLIEGEDVWSAHVHDGSGD